MVRVLGIQLDLGESAGEDAERAERWAFDLLTEERAFGDLERDLRAFAEDTETVRSALVVENEDLHRSLFTVRRGKIDRFGVARDGQGRWLVEGREDLSELAADLAERDLIRVGTPKTSAATKEREIFAAHVAAAKEAVDNRDVSRMIELFRSRALAGTRGRDARASIARALVSESTPDAADVLFDALRDEVPSIAHVIGYRLYVQSHLASRLLAEIEAAWRDRPRLDVYLARLAAAVQEWPDFPYPQGWIEAADPLLVRLLDPRDADAPKTKLSALMETTVRALERGTFEAVRRSRQRLNKAKPEPIAKMRELFAERLRAVLASKAELTIRAAAFDLLTSLGVPAPEIVPLIGDFPAVGGVRKARLDARIDPPPPPAPLVFGLAPVAPEISHQDVLGAAKYPEGYVVHRAGDTIALVVDGRARWKIDAPNDSQILAVLGDHGGRAFVSCADGLVALDIDTGRELWCCGAIDRPTLTSRDSVVDPRPVVWARREQLLVLGTDHVTAVEPRSGRVVDVVDVPFAEAMGFALHEQGVLVLDGSVVFGGLHDTDLVRSGLLVRADLSAEDHFVPAVLASIVREVGGVRADFSRADVVLTSRAGEVRWALPPKVSHLGPVVPGAGGVPHALLFVSDPSSHVFGAGSWQALPLSVG